MAVVLLPVAGAKRQEQDPLLMVSRPYHFNLAGWELRNFPSRWLYLLRHPWGKPDPASQESLNKVERYFDLARLKREEETRLEQIQAGMAVEGVTPQTQQRRIAALGLDQSKLARDVEYIIERLVEQVIQEEGLQRRVLGVGHIWPPVDYTFERTPKVLIISPRDRIELLETRLIKSGVSLEEREVLEDSVMKQDLSGFVENIGGVSTYPSIVQGTSDLRFALELVSHEWLHAYLFFHPLGRAYDRLTTINETVADIWGREVGRRVYCRYWGPCPAEPSTESPRPPSDPSAFDFNREMRATRLEVDRLLSEKKVAEAEAFMEERRIFLLQHGYAIRKLNQAFFAFHGSYADTPTSVDPVGQQLKDLRTRSPSLGAFVRAVQSIDSQRDYKATVLGQ
ncbi:MAG: hypothetical protein HYX97_06450 [Chloroflexi bacterium]|nr:hypothetical protein [Chloroflexota bacterium]